jgi:pSer/pThr/pTyr-binding forkhead associated (FHA) protein
MQIVLHLGPDGVGGQVLRLHPGTYIVGRSPDCQIRIPKRAVSRRHCVLAVGSDHATVHDVGSRSGTCLNARLVADEQALRDGDRLAVCGITFRVRVLADSAPADSAWCTVPQTGPGITLDPEPDPPRSGPRASWDRGSVDSQMYAADLAPGPYDIPLNIPGYDLTLHLELLNLIGRGSFGQVWRSRTRGTGPDCHEGAVKVGHCAEGSEMGDLCRWGAMAAARVPPHPSLLLPKMIGSFSGRPMVETTLADNSLADLAGVLPRADLRSRLVTAIGEVAAGLDHLHGHGLVHACPKPDDILFVHGRAAIADWDLTHPAHVTEGARATATYGDPEYVAPEVWAGWASGQSDQYALACVYVRLRTGHPVFPVWERAAWQRCHQTEEPGLGGLPVRERVVTGRALAKEAGRRHTSCLEFARALVAAAGSDRGG